MEAATPSRTALGVALRRAVHQLADAQPHILADPIAAPILLPTYRDALDKAIAGKNDPGSRMLRTWLVARSRYAEDNLALAVSRGIRQYVLLGAGLDTFAHRNPHTGLRVFEVDHPATQHWKRGLLSEHNIAHPDALTYVPVDFESQSLIDELHAAGFDSTQPTLFAWLGVTMYLCRLFVERSRSSLHNLRVPVLYSITLRLQLGYR
jgi:methyltransferase (TIGR00027 family)